MYMEKLFVHRGCPTERTPPTHDFGADLKVTLDGEPTVIQCKQKPKVGIGAIQQVNAAKGHYKGTKRCIVITTGEFTRDALEEAKVLGVKCWDGKRLLEEIYKDQFFYLPE
jgi:restriction system protein